jgi:hypothetical protein
LAGNDKGTTLTHADREVSFAILEAEHLSQEVNHLCSRIERMRCIKQHQINTPELAAWHEGAKPSHLLIQLHYASASI